MAKLKGKIFKVGGSYAFLVPKALVDSEVIKTNTVYEFEPHPTNPNSSDNSLYTFPLGLNVAEVS